MELEWFKCRFSKRIYNRMEIKSIQRTLDTCVGNLKGLTEDSISPISKKKHLEGTQVIKKILVKCAKFPEENLD